MSETGNQIWGVGVELSEDHLGALRFAGHLAGPDDALVGVHVMPESTRLHPLLSQEQTAAMSEQVASDVALLLERAGASGRVEVRVIEDDHPELGLVETAVREHFTALIVGRRARRDEDPLIRLGEISRRVLRKLPVPVIVVPPDFGSEPDEPALDSGPVVLATNLDEHCVAAAEFAKRLAARLDRPILVAHGTEAFNWGVSYIPAETFEVMLDQARARAGAKLHAWVKAQGLEGAQEHVFLGDPARNLAHLVEERKAAVLVTGSRKLGPIERVFLASVSSELAGSTRCPTAVVPG
ncbi:universal stress protein [Nannocystaceae bacterium ST9]